jgi:hypothetical protein
MRNRKKPLFLNPNAGHALRVDVLALTRFPLSMGAAIPKIGAGARLKCEERRQAVNDLKYT